VGEEDYAPGNSNLEHVCGVQTRDSASRASSTTMLQI